MSALRPYSPFTLWRQVVTARGSVSFGANHSSFKSGEQMLFDGLLDAKYAMAYEGIGHINRRPLKKVGGFFTLS